MDGRGSYRGQTRFIARRRRSSSAVVEGIAVNGHAGKEGGDQGHARHVEHLKTVQVYTGHSEKGKGKESGFTE
jgi:hypothetical protein